LLEDDAQARQRDLELVPRKSTLARARYCMMRAEQHGYMYMYKRRIEAHVDRHNNAYIY
jgi:hypothetical protein